MTVLRFSRAGILAVILTAASHPAQLVAGTLPDRLELGRDANGQRCIATRGWSVGNHGVNFERDQGFSITCSGVAAARVQGYVTVPSASALADRAAPCGEARSASVPGLGAVEVRRCFDGGLQASTIALSTKRRNGVYHGAALETALPTLQVLLRAVALGDYAPDSFNRANVAIDVSQVPPAPLAPTGASTPTRTGLSAQTALKQGVDMIHAGRRIEASRLLNDAISDFGAAPALVQAELRLNAGLADSDIGQFQSAKDHFDAAQGLLAKVPDSDLKTNLSNESAVYRALDQINQRNWAQALTVLDAKAVDRFPLTDPVILSQINQGAKRTDAAAAVGVSDSGQLIPLVVEAELNWARSVAYLGLGQIEPSRSALSAAAVPVRTLQASAVQASSIVWLRATLERQRGRIEARAGSLDAAVAGFDCAILTLQGAPLSTPLGCLFESPAKRGATITANLTAIAETQLEREGIRARKPGVDQASLLADFDTAVDTLTSGNGANGGAPPALSGYLDALVKAAAQSPSDAINERFFKAMQATGEPAIAREVVRLQTVLAADNAVQAQFADRAELEREVVRLRYEIQAVAPGDKAALDVLIRERDTAQAALDTVNTKIPPALNLVDEKTVKIADVRHFLKSGEVYLKLVALNGHIYGAAISSDSTMIYRVAKSRATIEADTRAVLASARSFRGKGGDLRLHAFAVDAAFNLFTQIAGPAREMLTKAKSITYDPVGELRNLPAAILVTAAQSPTASGARKARIDYTDVAFLGRETEIATALSPRSFVVNRGKTVQSAPKLFLGLGETVIAPEPTDGNKAVAVQLAPGCRVSYANWVAAYNSNLPISAREIGLSAKALGAGDAPMITGAQFTDANLQRVSALGDLAQYQVLHFATHGLTAEPFDAPGCDQGLPPALLTTLVAPDASGLIVSNGLLSYDRVAALRLNANLVFLSACETASGVSEKAGRLTGQEDSTPSLDGLVRAFLAANSRAVVATLWSVPASDDTDQLIETFYRNGRVASIAASLRAAQSKLMMKPGTSHPYFWGAYFIVGDGSKMMLQTPGTMVQASR